MPCVISLIGLLHYSLSLLVFLGPMAFYLDFFFLARILCFEHTRGDTIFADFVRGALVAAPPLFLDATRYVTRCVLKKQPDAWCSDSFSMYATVQQNYWHVGFLRYWRFKQIPNFILATPAISLATRSLVLRKRNLRLLWRIKPYKKTFNNSSIHLGLWLHCAATLFLLLLFAHIEIATRILFHSTLLISWTLADDMFCSSNYSLNKKIYARALLVYIFLYTVLGTAAHVNFYPWT
mmetsp:Transcript_7510/g.11234  ORF Transcript_7510/g.11234 Transcript_7510/m.11234 type:complete len:236 (+) Transcript_7510:546-1253(+)